MSIAIVALATFVIFATHFLGAIAAYGSTLLALPLLVFVVDDLPLSVLALVVIGAAQSYQVLWYTWRDVGWRVFGRMLAVAGAGLPIGFVALRVLPERPLMIFLGTILLASGVSRLAMRNGDGAWKPPRLALDALLFVGGVIHGAFASGGATVVVYAQYVFGSKETFRATLCAFWTVLNTVVIAATVAREPITREAWILIGAAGPLSLLANWLGNRCALRMSQDKFMRFVAALLALAGCVTIFRAVCA
ncbi:MAG: Sulfite exporter TauE/SafE [candidate division BRC1 bacterium ADurb.BinA364]|nr:MAG: Sulfite exporter TauE/SafE [candidate division BRC1 bacterium ADurb.BinA364]